MPLSTASDMSSTLPDVPLSVVYAHNGMPASSRPIRFSAASRCTYEILRRNLLQKLQLSANSDARISWKDHDNNSILISSNRDLRQAIAYFESRSDDSSVSSAASSQWGGSAHTHKITICVDVDNYNGPALSDVDSFSLGSSEDHGCDDQVSNLSSHDSQDVDGADTCTVCHTEVTSQSYRCTGCASHNLCHRCHDELHELDSQDSYLVAVRQSRARSIRRSTTSTSRLLSLDEELDEFSVNVSTESQTLVDSHGVNAFRAPVGTPTSLDHRILCGYCESSIIGVCYQCANCPSDPPSTTYNLCADCEALSYIYHDATHVFMKLPRPVDRLISEPKPLPILYSRPAGPVTHLADGANPKAYLRYKEHKDIRCDQPKCRGRIVGEWYKCMFCLKDLCSKCEALGTHDDTHVHVFMVFKSDVNVPMLERVTGMSGKGARPKAILKKPVYLKKRT